jgi:L-iditol 2-dehydrogenase
MEARVAVVTSPGELRMETRTVPEPGPGEALLRVHECGICGSDLKLYSGKHPVVKPPIMLGHEFYGSVEALGPDGEGPDPGSLVAVFAPVGCGHCYACRRDLPHLCPDMEFIGGQRPGGLSELVVVPAANLVPIGTEVPADRRVLVEPLAVGVHAASRGQVGPDDHALVIGAGPIGLFTALALRAQGVAQVLLTDLSDERLALARRLGAGDTVNTREVDLDREVRERVRPEGVDVAFDCVGLEATAADALRLTAKGGRVVLVGLMPAEMKVDGVALQRGERSLIGVQQYVRADYSTAMDILAAGALPATEELIRLYRLEEAATALDELAEGRTDVLKYAVSP